MARIEDSVFSTLTQRFNRVYNMGDQASLTQTKLGTQNIGRFPLNEDADNSNKIFTGFTEFTSSRSF